MSQNDHRVDRLIGIGVWIVVISFILFTLTGCAASQGYHRYDEDDGYPVKPGSDSGKVTYHNKGKNVQVSGTTTNLPSVISAASNADMQDRYMSALEECQRSGRCSMYGYNMYSYPGWGPAPMTSANPSAPQATNQLSAEPVSGCKTPEDACLRANDALRGAKLSARAVHELNKNQPEQKGAK